MAHSSGSPGSSNTPRMAAEKGAGLPYAVLACMLVFYWSIFSRALTYTLMPTVGAELRLSNSAAGLAIAVMLLGFSFGNWSSGWLPGSRRARIVGGVALSLPGVVLLSQAAGTGTLMVGAGLMGLGVGFYLPLGLSLLVEAGGQRNRARFMAVHELAGTLGSFSGSTFVAVMLFWTDWRGTLLMAGLVGAAAVVAFARVRDSGGQAVKRGSRGRVPLDLRLVYSATIHASVSILLMGLISVLPLIMVRAWGLSQADAASVIGYTRLAGLLAVLMVGLKGDRWGHSRMLRMFQLLSLAGTSVMSLNGYGPLFLAGVLVLAVGAVGTVSLQPLIIAGAYPQDQREQALASANSVGGLVGMVGAPALFGALMDLGLTTAPIVLSVATTLVAILVTGRIRPYREAS
ncbi:MAG: MFS transporter [Sphingomonadaceae bacterium]